MCSGFRAHFDKTKLGNSHRRLQTPHFDGIISKADSPISLLVSIARALDL
jgi:hypothetical protein